MCISDWRLGRLVRAISRTEAIQPASDLLIAAVQQRVGISFLLPLGTFNVDVVPDADYALDTGFRMSTSVGFYHFTVTNHGDLPMRRWTVHNLSVITANVGIIEYFLPEEVLSQAMEELRSVYK